MLASVFGTLFTEVNKDPRMIREYYNQKLDKLREAYDKANKSYRLALGKVEATREAINQAEREFEKSNNNAITASKKGLVEDARMFAATAMTAKTKLQTLKESLATYVAQAESAKNLRDKANEAVRTVENTRDNDVERAERNKAAIEIYNAHEGNKTSNTIDNILAGIQSGLVTQEEEAVGARIAFETSDEQLQFKAEKRIKEADADSYLAQLMNSVK